MKTTLYNHNEIGTNEKPVIENREFKVLCQQVDVIYDTLKAKSLEDYQKKLIADKLNIVKQYL